MKFTDDGVTLAEGWQSELGEDLQGDKTLADIKDVPGMAKMLVSAQRMVGADKLSLPGEDAPEEAWSTFYTSIGRPADAKGYGLEAPEDLPEGMEIDQERLGTYQEIAHKAGLRPSQAKQLYDWYNETASTNFTQQQTAQATAQEDAEKELRLEWGETYNDNLKKALTAVRTFVDPESVKILNESGLGNAPWLIKAFSKIGESIAEDRLEVSHVSDNKVSAQAEIDRIMGDLTHPYHKKDAPGHTAAVHKVEDLFRRVFPE